MKFKLFLILSLFAISGCKKENSEEQAVKDDEIIRKYIADYSLNATKTSTGLYYVIQDPGTGASCSSSSNVRVAYKGYYTSNAVFDESDANGITFNLANVIKGWTEGIPYFKEGGSGILLIPSALAYGASGSGSVPPNTVLIFDVELIEVL